MEFLLAVAMVGRSLFLTNKLSIFLIWNLHSVSDTCHICSVIDACHSCYVIMSMCMCRYFAICHSFSAVPLRQHMRLIVAAVWLVAIVIMAPWLYAYDLREVYVPGPPGTPVQGVSTTQKHMFLY